MQRGEEQAHPELELADYADPEHRLDDDTRERLLVKLAGCKGAHTYVDHLAPGWAAVPLPIGIPAGTFVDAGEAMLVNWATLRWHEDRGWLVWLVDGRVPDPETLPN